MDLKEIRQLIKMIEESEISEIEIEEKDKKIKISKNFKGQTQSFQQYVPTASPQVAAPVVTTSGSQSKRPDNVIEVKSPMVGTFYRSASPDSDPYVDVGKAVKTGDVLCIVEAMKLMNEIESEVSGRIVEILVDNAQPVEFNQVLFIIEKA